MLDLVGCDWNRSHQVKMEKDKKAKEVELMWYWIIAIASWVTLWLAVLMITPKETKKKKWFRELLFYSGRATVASGVVVLLNHYWLEFWNSSAVTLACGLVLLILLGPLLLVRQRRLRPTTYV